MVHVCSLSDFESFQQHLKPLQGWHGVHNTHPTWAEHTFGVFGPDVPSVAIESEPGDFVLFHHSLYHAVYNHSPDRRLVQGSWVAYPDTPEFKASCFRSGGGIFTARPALAAHSDADIRQLTLSALCGGFRCGQRKPPQSGANVIRGSAWVGVGRSRRQSG